MNNHRENMKNITVLLSFGCWNGFGESFKSIILSHEIQIHSSDKTMVHRISLKLKMEIIKKDNVFTEIKINDNIYKASSKSIQQLSELVAARVTYLGIKDNYSIIRQIGCGGQAEGVFEVHGIYSKEIKAMKQYLKSYHSVEKIHKEIKITQKFQSKSVIRIDEVYESESSIYIIYEKLKIFNPVDYSLEQKTQFIYDLLNIVQIIHSLGYMHRDIKLSNIMINSQNKIKVIDFGLATKCKKQHKQCGTPGHMAPEVFTTKCYDEKCEIFSLGVLVYQILSEQQLFQGSKQDIKNKNKFGIYEIRKLSYLPLEFQELLKAMLQRDPTLRISAQMAKLSPLFAKDLNNSCMTDTTWMYQSNEQQHI